MPASGSTMPGYKRGYLKESLFELWQRPAHQMPALDAVRAVAVIAVILSHFYAVLWLGHIDLLVPDMSLTLPFYYGWTGVDLFFVLSGFLIGRQLWLEKQRTGTVSVLPFLLRRGFRIWPLYFAMLLLGLASGAFQPSVADALFLSNYFYSGFSRSWTLSTEEQFYIVVPLLLVLTPWIRKLHWYFWILGAVVVSVWVSRYYACQALLSTGMAVCEDEMVAPIHLHNEALIAGLAIALLSVIRPDYFKPLPPGSFSWRGFSVLIVAGSLAALLYKLNSTVFSFTALALIFGSATLWLMWDRSWVSRPASWRIWYPISRLSYGMYLNHFLFLTGINAWITVAMIGLTGPVVGSVFGIVCGTLISMALATVTFVCVERPFLLWREQLSFQREPGQPIFRGIRRRSRVSSGL